MHLLYRHCIFYELVYFPLRDLVIFAVLSTMCYKFKFVYMCITGKNVNVGQKKCMIFEIKIGKIRYFCSCLLICYIVTSGLFHIIHWPFDHLENLDTNIFWKDGGIVKSCRNATGMPQPLFGYSFWPVRSEMRLSNYPVFSKDHRAHVDPYTDL